MDDDEKLISAFRELHAELLALGGDQGRAADRIRDLRDDVERLRGAFFKSQAEVCDTLGRALGYPFYKDDPENFPGATSEADGVCTGDHVAETIAAEAADRLSALKAERDAHEAAGRRLADAAIAEVARAEKAEAERDRMAAALRDIDALRLAEARRTFDIGNAHEVAVSRRDVLIRVFDIARAALSQEPTPHRS